MVNLGTETVQLTERNWSIFCVSGTLETQRGRGVIGQDLQLPLQSVPITTTVVSSNHAQARST
jgi:uncharacterized protein affecting Mg2+/Co2+ transport